MKLAFRLKSKRLARVEELLGDLVAQIDRTEATVERCFDDLKTLLMENRMDIQTLTNKVEAMNGTVASVAVLMNGLGDLVRQHLNDPAALQALADKIDADSATLAAAVAANPLPAPAGAVPGSFAGTATPEVVNPADHVVEPL